MGLFSPSYREENRDAQKLHISPQVPQLRSDRFRQGCLARNPRPVTNQVMSGLTGAVHGQCFWNHSMLGLASMSRSNPKGGLLSLLLIQSQLTVIEPLLHARITVLRPTRKFSPRVAEGRWRLRKGKGLARCHSAGCQGTPGPGADLLLHGPQWDPRG